MICEVFNEMMRFVDYVFGGNNSYRSKIELWEVVLMTILFLISLLVISWWLIPIQLLFKKYGNMTFYCNSKKGE